MEDHTRHEVLDLEVGEVLRLPCAECDRTTNHEVIRSVSVSRDYDFMEHNELFQIVKCRGCEHLSFRHNWTSSEDFEVDQDDGSTYYLNHESIYPHRLAGRRPLEKTYLIPAAIGGIYSETHGALSAGHRVLAGVGMRAVVEAVCADQEATGSNLQNRIDCLVNLGVLTRDGAEVLHAIRSMGNFAAHEVISHSELELRGALDVVEHLLLGVYILKKRTPDPAF